MRNSQEHRDQSPLSRSRSVSVSSDAATRVLLSSPPHVEPSPAFIAASSASQIVNVDMEQNDVTADNEDEASITPNGLALLNGFLDYLLFSFLASAKSTELSALRPAIADVLKPRLAREVVVAADEELGEYMGNGEEDELQEFRGGRAPHGEFDLVRAWKLARLRCMVYTRLGDLEEEEEDEYISREGLDESGGAPRRFSGHAGNITPAAAIFLTSIIEYLGEHALIIAGENARNRVFSATRLASRLPSPEGAADMRMIVDESDMEKLALNPTLGRLWRTWKKGIRSPTLSRSFSRESFVARRSFSSNKGGIVNMDDLNGRDSRLDEPVEEEEDNSRPTSVDPADIALPLNDDDIDEIEVPGLWVDVDEIETMQAAVAQIVRPRSLIVYRSGSMTPTSPSSSKSPGTWPATNSPLHNRSHSVPIQVEILKQNDHGSSRESRPSLETVNENEGTEAVINGETSLTQDRGDVVAPYAKEQDVSDGITDRDRSQASNDAQQTAIGDEIVYGDGDRRSSEGEVVEGQGTYQRPNLTMQRPKRKSSKDTARKDSPAPNVVETRAASASYHDDNHPPLQGGAIVHDVGSASTQQISDPVSDTSHSYRYDAKIESITNGIAPTSHPRQLVTTVESAPEEAAGSLPRDSLNANRHDSSFYTESIGAPPSASEESEDSVYRSIPSRAASHTASIRSQPRQDDQSTSRERATVQRVYGATPTSQASIRSRRSASISDKRPLTSGSTTSNVSSKLKVLIGRHPADADVPLPAPPRRSSDASKFTTDDVDETNLDELIKSDETIRFTLTPRTMREIELPGSPRWNTARNDIHNDRADTSDLAEFFKNTAPPGQSLPSPRPPTERSIRSTPRQKPASPMFDGLRAHPAPDTGSERSSPTSLRAPSRAVSQSSNRSKGTMHQAREARVAGDSVRDFAQFIRSTGPQAAPVNSSNSRPEVNTRTHGRDGSGSVVSSSRPDTAQSVSSWATAKPRESYNSSRKNGPRLEAREAAGHNSNKTSELIDFIREGPPGASTHRIPRTVAPFRNTMDSEDLLLIEAARDNDITVTPSLASTGAESIASSRAPLLTKSNPSDAPPIPRRKRRGPRDPYAIDFSDDEEDLEMPIETTKRPNAPRAEESMLDFLNSAPPPVTQKAPEPFILSSYPVPPNVPSGQSTSNSKSRFRRNTFGDKSSTKGPTSKKSITSMRSAKLQSSKSQISPPMPQSFRRPSIPTAPGQPGQMPPKASGYAAQLNRERVPGSQPSAPQSTRQTDTGDLADFLRNTGPPAPIPRASSVMTEDKKDSTFSRFFRRKRVEA